MKAVIMAGGEGSRLRPLTCDRPKPMVPVMNRPLMEYCVELLADAGCREIAVTLQYLPEQIMEHFGDGSGFGVSLRYYIEEQPLGTAGSVKNTGAFLDETFVVVSGDALTDFNLEEALHFHRSRGAAATLVLTAVDNPLEYGVVMTAPDGRIERFLEKPSWGEVFSDTVNTGIYIIEPEVLGLFEPGQVFDFSKDLFPKMLSAGMPLFGCILEGFWCDIGNIKEYCRAHREVLDGRVRVHLKGSYEAPGIWLEEGVAVSPLARLESPVYLGAGCTVEAGAQVRAGSVLGTRTTVGERATVKRGITWEGASLGAGSALRGGILCKEASLGGRAAVYEEAVVGDGSSLQEGAYLKPGVKVWPAKVVESGVVLHDSLVWGEKASRSLFGHDGVRGEVNRGLTPEMALRLGAVFGSMAGPGAVLTSSDGGRPARMIKEAVESGLLSAGAHVLDGGELLLPMARRSVGVLGAGGGAHVSVCPGGECQVRLRFFDGTGLPFSRGDERKMEQLYFREDFRRAPGEQVGEVVSLPNLPQLYQRELLESVSPERIARAGLRVVLGYPSPFLGRFLVPLLQKLQCSTITFHSGEALPASRYDARPLPHHRKEIAGAVRNNSASLGVFIEPEGERVLLFDERGRSVEGDLYTALLSLLQLRLRKGGIVTVPVTAPAAVDELARRYRGRVVRTKTIPRLLMEPGNGGDGTKAGCRPGPAESLPFDSLAALVHLLDVMAGYDQTLSGLLAEIPSITLQEKETPCPWSQKGKVMRRLVQEASREKIEMIDGLKVYHPQGWALIMPDPERPAYRVYGEGYSEEISSSLTEFYVQRISELQREN